MKTYDLVLEVLRNHPETRGDDKKLIWIVWKRLGFIVQGRYAEGLTRESFFNRKLPPMESITRARRKAQELHPELKPNKNIQRLREAKRKTKGTYIYRENIDKYIWK